MKQKYFKNMSNPQCKYARRFALCIATCMLTSCAKTSSKEDNELSKLQLFGNDGTPHFIVYLSCAGQVTAETELCWVPSKYFDQWAGERHVLVKHLHNGTTFDERLGVPVAELVKADSRYDYRIFVRFMPIALPSVTSENDGMGGYIAPKAGYEADLFVYSTSSGKLATRVNYHKKTDAQFKGDAVPYVKAGVQTVLTALDPAFAQNDAIGH